MSSYEQQKKYFQNRKQLRVWVEAEKYQRFEAAVKAQGKYSSTTRRSKVCFFGLISRTALWVGDRKSMVVVIVVHHADKRHLHAAHHPRTGDIHRREADIRQLHLGHA